MKNEAHSVVCQPTTQTKTGKDVYYDVQAAVVGAGPAGLSAALEIAKRGGTVSSGG